MKRIIAVAVIVAALGVTTFAQQPTTKSYRIPRAEAIELLDPANDYLKTDTSNDANIRDWVVITVELPLTMEKARAAARLTLGVIGHLNSQGKPHHPCANGERGEECSGDARGVKVTPHPVTKTRQ